MSSVRRIVARADEVRTLAAQLASPPPDPNMVPRVAEIVRSVRESGDEALVEIVRRFDSPDFAVDRLRVSVAELEEARASLADDLREAIEFAADQVRALAVGIRPEDQTVTLPVGQSVIVRSVPVGAAGVYVPGGRAVYPSSLIMAVVPAQAAGVPRIAVCSPPRPDGTLDPAILGAAAVLGVDEVYAVGGPAAIAALAFGTDTIPAVDVITGPGNAWVQEAKRQVFGTVGIDGIAGPSEVVVIADADADPREVAADLLAQAEHGPDSPAIALSPETALLDAVQVELERHRLEGAITLIDVDSLDTAIAFSEAFAPEHLQLMTRDGMDRAGSIRNAGCVFVGVNGATAFGDYVAGTNHILPTGGSARFASAVSPATYLRRMSVVTIPDESLRPLAGHLAVIANAEGFTFHRRSAEIRAARSEGEPR